MPSAKQMAGTRGELSARNFLENKGYTFVDQNWFCRYGELDLVMRDKQELVFVEVKMRSDTSFGYPEDMVSWTKMKKLSKTAYCYIQENNLQRSFWRFDVIAILNKNGHDEIKHFMDVIRD